MKAAFPSVTRHWGETFYTPAQTLSEFLGYDRKAVSIGRSLPIPPDHRLQRTLKRCEQVMVAFDGKLGDALLAFAAVVAITDALALDGRTVPLRMLGRYGQLYPGTPLASSMQRSSPRLIVGDEPGVTLAKPTGNDYVLICRPEKTRCFHDGRRAHPFLPARYYLEVERRAGVRLPGELPFLPPLAHSNSVLGEKELTVAAVVATSRPDRKDYGIERFIAAARLIGERTRHPVRLLLVLGRGKTASQFEETADDFQTECVGDADLKELAFLFSQCDVVLGNDTGLTHLAALSSSSTEVIGLYGRHSHSKWRTGLGHHHALATPFSEHMHRRDLCPVRDGLDEKHTSQTPLSSIPPAMLAETAILALERALS